MNITIVGLDLAQVRSLGFEYLCTGRELAGRAAEYV
jgi:hypothetical protein